MSVPRFRVPAAGVERVRDDRCVRCGYDLRGLTDDSPCPECGLLAERSRTRSAHLDDASPRWLRGIALGIALILIAHVVELLLPPVINQLGDSMGSIRVPTRSAPTFLGVAINYANLQRLALLGHDVAAVLFASGMFLLTAAQQAGQTPPRDRPLRFALRFFSFMPLAVCGYLHGLFYLRGYFPFISLYSTYKSTEEWIVFLAISVGCAPIPAILFIYLRRMARRVLDARLAEHAAIVGVGLTLSMLLVPSVMLICAFQNASSRPYQVLWLDVTTTRQSLIFFFAWIFVILFMIWSAANCLRFMFAFWRAHRAAKRNWTLADRAAAVR